MKKYSVVLAVMLMAAMVFAACKPAAPAATEAPVVEEPVVPFKVCMVTDSAGIGDKSFNDAVWKGLQQAVTDFGIEANYIESKSADDYAPNLQACVDSEPDVVVCVGFMMGDACQVSVEANPDLYYIGIDINWLTYPNLLGVDAYMDQSSFQAGYLAAGTSKTGILAGYTGFFGPVVQIFLDGFYMGMMEYNNVHGTSVTMLGYDPAKMDETAAIGSWIDVDAGRALSETYLNNGADIFYPVCGNVGTGTAAAMQDLEAKNPDFKGYIFGMDQDWVETNPQYSAQILGSALKKMEVPVYAAIEGLVTDGSWIGGTNYVLTLENGGTSLAYNPAIDIPVDLKAEVDALKDKIISGEIPSLSPEYLALYPRE